jgi:hypothetical protein
MASIALMVLQLLTLAGGIGAIAHNTFHANTKNQHLKLTKAIPST